MPKHYNIKFGKLYIYIYYMTSVIKSIQWWIWTYIIWTWIFNNYMYLFEIEDTWWTQNCRGLKIYINVHQGIQFIWLNILQTIGDRWTPHKAKLMQAMSIPLIILFYLNWKINYEREELQDGAQENHIHFSYHPTKEMFHWIWIQIHIYLLLTNIAWSFSSFS
jgi:hypothetical protein